MYDAVIMYIHTVSSTTLDEYIENEISQHAGL